MSYLKAIIVKADTKEQKEITCRGCGGTGIKKSFMHVSQGECFNCNGTGKVPNKWKKIKIEAIAIQNQIQHYKEKITELEKLSESEDRIIAHSAKLDLERIYDKTKIKESLRRDITKLAKKAGII